MVGPADPQTIIEGLETELSMFAELLDSLSDDEMTTPTRCAGWTVADVAGHVVGTVSELADGRFELLAQSDSADRQANERSGRSATELGSELHGAARRFTSALGRLDDRAWQTTAPAGLGNTVGEALEDLWADLYVHGDDIRDALGWPSDRGAGLEQAVRHYARVLERQGWEAHVELEGLGPIVIGRGGPLVQGDALTFVLVATGRAHPIELGLNESLNLFEAP